jgi:hypothetical protein
MGGDEGEGEMRMESCNHPHPNPSPSMGRGNKVTMEICNYSKSLYPYIIRIRFTGVDFKLKNFLANSDV